MLIFCGNMLAGVEEERGATDLVSIEIDQAESGFDGGGSVGGVAFVAECDVGTASNPASATLEKKNGRKRMHRKRPRNGNAGGTALRILERYSA